MQFTTQTETDCITVNFYNISKLKEESRIKLYEVLNKLGMTFRKGDQICFPKHITFEVLQEVIHNTCFVCGGLMKDYEYHSDHIVRKCQSCGHSHT